MFKAVVMVCSSIFLTARATILKILGLKETRERMQGTSRRNDSGYNEHTHDNLPPPYTITYQCLLGEET